MYVLCNDGSISWKNFKQPIMVDSTMKAKYIAALKAVKKAFWYKQFIVKLKVMPSDAILFYCDNNGAIALAKEFGPDQKSKHIEQ